VKPENTGAARFYLQQRDTAEIPWEATKGAVYYHRSVAWLQKYQQSGKGRTAFNWHPKLTITGAVTKELNREKTSGAKQAAEIRDAESLGDAPQESGERPARREDGGADA
jgi:hypothetical protein